MANNSSSDTPNSIEALRTFALTHNEIAFAHLCTAALAGEEWAIERIAVVTERASGTEFRPTANAAELRAFIRNTDTSRPDGAIARTLREP